MTIPQRRPWEEEKLPLFPGIRSQLHKGRRHKTTTHLSLDRPSSDKNRSLFVSLPLPVSLCVCLSCNINPTNISIGPRSKSHPTHSSSNPPLKWYLQSGKWSGGILVIGCERPKNRGVERRERSLVWCEINWCKRSSDQATRLLPRGRTEWLVECPHTRVQPLGKEIALSCTPWQARSHKS